MVTPNIIALVHSDQPPSDESWRGHHELIIETVGHPGRFVEVGYFVITAGGAPNARQRREGNLLVKGHRMVRAVVTDSFFVRQLVKSWSWFAPGMSAFGPDELREALRTVGVPENMHAEVWPQIVALNQALENPVSWVPTELPPG